MKTGDLIAKLARGEKLGAGEVEALRLQLNEQQNVASTWGGYLHGSKIAIPGRPEDLCEIKDHPAIRILAPSQDVPASIETYLTFTFTDIPDYIKTGFSVDFTADPTHIAIPESGIYFVVADFYVPYYADSTVRQSWIQSSYTGVGSSGLLALDSHTNAAGLSAHTFLSTIFFANKGDLISLGSYNERVGGLSGVYAYISIFRIRGIN